YAEALRTAGLVRLGQGDEEGYHELAERARAELKQTKSPAVAAACLELLLTYRADERAATELLLQVETWQDRAKAPNNFAALRGWALVRSGQASQALAVLDKTAPTKGRAAGLNAMVRALTTAKDGQRKTARQLQAEAIKELDELCAVKPTYYYA